MCESPWTTLDWKKMHGWNWSRPNINKLKHRNITFPLVVINNTFTAVILWNTVVARISKILYQNNTRMLIHVAPHQILWLNPTRASLNPNCAWLNPNFAEAGLKFFKVFQNSKSCPESVQFAKSHPKFNLTMSNSIM